MDRLLDRLLANLSAIIVVLGAITVVSVGLAVADDSPTPTDTGVTTQLDLPDDHERMLATMRAPSVPQAHLDAMAADPDWRGLRDSVHTRHLEDYQQEVDRQLGRTRSAP